MHSFTSLVMAALLGRSAHLVTASGCQNVGGVANGECVKYFSGDSCTSNGIEEGSYKPTCEGNCFQYGFDSLFVSGDGTYGTDCHAYSDSNCQHEIANSGNVVVGTGHCLGAGGAQSMTCYYRC